jgi:hypothetical protein
VSVRSSTHQSSSLNKMRKRLSNMNMTRNARQESNVLIVVVEERAVLQGNYNTGSRMHLSKVRSVMRMWILHLQERSTIDRSHTIKKNYRHKVKRCLERRDLQR